MTLPVENQDNSGGRTRTRKPGGQVMAYHHRIAAIAATLALTLGVPAAAAASGNSTTTHPACTRPTIPLITGYPR